MCFVSVLDLTIMLKANSDQVGKIRANGLDHDGGGGEMHRAETVITLLQDTALAFSSPVQTHSILLSLVHSSISLSHWLHTVFGLDWVMPKVCPVKG